MSDRSSVEDRECGMTGSRSAIANTFPRSGTAALPRSMGDEVRAAAHAQPGEAGRRVVRMEAWALLSSRGAALLNVAVALGTAAHGRQAFAGAVVLAAALLVESVLLGVATLRRGRLPQWVGFVDLAVSCAALAVNAVLLTVTRMDVHTWGFFAYPYTLVASCACGLLLRGPWLVGGAGLCLALVYGVSDHLSSGQPLWNSVPNGASYLGVAVAVWIVAHQVRRMGAQLDASRAVALELAGREAVLQERNKQSRLLHDRVLQTLETLGGGQWVADPWMRDQVRAEAAWLRWLIQHGPNRARTDSGSGALHLGAALHALAQQRVRHGLKVSVTFPPAPEDDFSAVPGHVADALLAACHEVLTNVVKHAGTDRATVWAAVEDGEVIVSVVDQGRGFDPATQPEGIGLPRSIRGRLEEIGGTVRIDSAPGEGTWVELRAPHSRSGN